MNIAKLLILAGIPVTKSNIETTRQVLAELDQKMEEEKCKKQKQK